MKHIGQHTASLKQYSNVIIHVPNIQKEVQSTFSIYFRSAKSSGMMEIIAKCITQIKLKTMEIIQPPVCKKGEHSRIELAMNDKMIHNMQKHANESVLKGI